MLSPRQSQEYESRSPRSPRDSFTVKSLTRNLGDRVLYSGIDFTVRSGETLFIRGPSGVGKTLLLRSLALLDPLDGGELSLAGRTPDQLGIPTWRTQVCYVFQQRIGHRGTPSELYFTAQKFGAQRGRPRADLPAIIHDLGLEQGVLNQTWEELSVRCGTGLRPCLCDAPSALPHCTRRPIHSWTHSLVAALYTLSHSQHQCCRHLFAPSSDLQPPLCSLQGGQAQRVQLAIAIALNPSVLLLDEPTSALDVESVHRVEQALKACGAALVWVSHDPGQPQRVGGRCLDLPAGIESAVGTPAASPDVALPPSLPRGPSRQSLDHANGVAAAQEDA